VPDCLGEPDLVAYAGSLRRSVSSGPENDPRLGHEGVPGGSRPVEDYPPLQRLA